MNLQPYQKTVITLSVLQALFQISMIVVITIASIISLTLAPNPHWITAVVSMLILSTALSLPLIGMAMQRYGRKKPFIAGSLLGVAGGLIGAYALQQQSFWLFCLTHILLGSYQASSQYYRFAAADVSPLVFKAKAVSYVVAGGVIAALLAPSIVLHTQHPQLGYIGTYIAIAMLCLVSLLVTLVLNPRMEGLTPLDLSSHIPFSFKQIAKRPLFWAALTAAITGSGLMMGLMTATPVAMNHSGHHLTETSSVIQWHVLAMFVPSFFTGALIVKWGIKPVLMTGIMAFVGHIVIAMSGDSFWHYAVALMCLGVGWNFLFIGATTLLAQSYQSHERFKVQMLYDTVVFSAASILSLSAGVLLDYIGWASLNALSFGLLASCVAIMTWCFYKEKTSAQNR